MCAFNVLFPLFYCISCMLFRAALCVINKYIKINMCNTYLLAYLFNN